MKNKLIFMSMIVVALLITLSAVSASDNITEEVSADDSQVISEVSLSQDEADITSQDSDDALGDAGQEEIAAEDDSVKQTVEKISDDTSKLSSSNSTVKKTSQLSASNKVGYQKFTSKVTVKLTADGKALASKKVILKLNGRTFKKITDKSGKVTLKFNLPKAKTYKLTFSYAGDNETASASGSSKIIIKKSYKTYFKVGDKYLNYRQGSKCLFYVKLVSETGRALEGKVIKFKVSGKGYRAKTNKNGIAKIYLNMKKGSRTISFKFSHSAPYFGKLSSHKVYVRAPMAKGNGYWLWPMHMKSVNLKSLANRGTKHILLHAYSITAYGKSYVQSFIKKAHGYGLKVHLWMQVCYDGDEWISPVNKDKGLTLKYGFMNSKIYEAVRYAKISGVDGIHLDYVRFGGTAHNYKSSAVKAINYIVKWSSYQIHKVKPNCIVSAAVMPEPDMMHYYYGQDIPSMSKYLDVIIPMVYKGNYNSGTSWIKSVTKTFVKQSNGAQIWAGLQAYKSDSDVTPLSQSELLKDARAAKSAGATGSILFRVGISHNFYFNKV